MIYFTLIFISLLAVFKKNKHLLSFVFFIIVLIAGLRYETGGDKVGYDNYYETTNSLSNYLDGDFTVDISTSKYYLEFFFTLLNSISKTFNFDVTGVYFLTALLSVFLIKNIIKKLPFLNKYIFIFLYICMLLLSFQMAYIRQGLAILFISNSLIYLTEKKYFKSLFLYVFAFGSHVMSTVVLTPILFICFINFYYSYIPILFSAAMLYFFNIKLLESITNYFSSFAGLDLLLLSYTDLNIDNHVKSLSITALFSIAISLYVIIFRKKIYFENKAYRYISNLIFTYCFLNFVITDFPVFTRIYFSLLLAFPLWFSFEYNYVKNKLIFITFTSFFGVIYFIRIFVLDESNSLEFFPYYSVLTFFL